MINTETDYLSIIADDIANRFPNYDGRHVDKHLFIEVNRLEKVITAHIYTIDNFTQRETYYFHTLTKLVKICDRLYYVNNSSNPDVQLLLNLLNVVRKIIPGEVSPKLQLPKASIDLLKDKLIDSWERNKIILKKNVISHKLIDIAGIPFYRFINAKHNLYWRDFTW